MHDYDDDDNDNDNDNDNDDDDDNIGCTLSSVFIMCSLCIIGSSKMAEFTESIHICTL